MGCLGGDQPDPAKGYVAGINTDLETLPARRLIEAMALLGDSGTVHIPGKRGGTDQFYDFTGLGQADVQRQYADQLTGELLAIQREFGPQYVEQRLRELEAADPEGAQMRRDLWDAIQTSASTTTDRPGAQAMQDLILEQINRAGQLDPQTERDISQAVMGGQVARGNYLGNAAAAEESSAIGAYSEAQRARAQEQAMAFLTGGYSPEDAAYREQTQDLANIGAFLAGETPTAQFGQLSGAQNGVVPFTTSGPLTGVNPNAGWGGVANQAGVFSARQAAGQSFVNPWVAGIAGAFNGANLWANLGGMGGGGAGAGAAGGSNIFASGAPAWASNATSYYGPN